MKSKDQNFISKISWKDSQRRIGLTGGIATGKSSISKFLEAEKNLPILDADLYAHEALSNDKEISKSIVQRYGKEIINSKNPTSIDRSALGKIIFSDKDERSWLEQLIFPYVTEKINKELVKKRECSTIILMIPLLFEASLENLCSEIWVVKCTLDQQYERLMKRDKISRVEAKQRINSQWPLDKKIQFADHVIDNTGECSKWKNQINKLI